MSAFTDTAGEYLKGFEVGHRAAGAELTVDVLAQAIHDSSTSGTGPGGVPSPVTRMLAERVRVRLAEVLGWGP